MADDTTTETVEQPEASSPGDLRAQIEAEKARNKALRDEVLNVRFEQAGIDPTGGPGKLLRTHYDGDATVDAIKAAALEYGIGGTADTTPDAAVTTGNPAAAQVAAGDDAMDALRANSTATPEPSIDDDIATIKQKQREAVAAGDHAAASHFTNQSIQAKLAKYKDSASA